MLRQIIWITAVLGLMCTPAARAQVVLTFDHAEVPPPQIRNPNCTRTDPDSRPALSGQQITISFSESCTTQGITKSIKATAVLTLPANGFTYKNPIDTPIQTKLTLSVTGEGLHNSITVDGCGAVSFDGSSGSAQCGQTSFDNVSGSYSTFAQINISFDSGISFIQWPAAYNIIVYYKVCDPANPQPGCPVACPAVQFDRID